MYIREPYIEAIHNVSRGIQNVVSEEQTMQLYRRSNEANLICGYLDKTIPQNSLTQKVFYQNITNILIVQPRLALYLPFSVLKNAPTSAFKEIYFYAWRSCWEYIDVREAFNVGDIYEKDASDGEPEWIVKAMHLAPWLLEYGYINVDTLVAVFEIMREETLLCWSLADAVEVMIERGSLTSSEATRLLRLIDRLPERPKPPKLTKKTPEREAWELARAANYFVPHDYRLQHPTGPFRNNITEFMYNWFDDVEDGEFLLLNGSRLKGYGRSESDIDLFHYDPISGLIREFEVLSGRPMPTTHIILTSAWIGKTQHETKMAQYLAAKRYFNLEPQEKEMCLLNLESSLLQFRLMHKGFPSAHPDDCAKETAGYDIIDGSSAFYDDRYRKIATELFVKYIVLP